MCKVATLLQKRSTELLHKGRCCLKIEKEFWIRKLGNLALNINCIEEPLATFSKDECNIKSIYERAFFRGGIGNPYAPHIDGPGSTAAFLIKIKPNLLVKSLFCFFQTRYCKDFQVVSSFYLIQSAMWLLPLEKQISGQCWHQM